jgi:S1-C subfamily serine protease
MADLSEREIKKESDHGKKRSKEKDDRSKRIENAVVELEVSSVGIKYAEPWSVRKTYMSTGSGFAIKISGVPVIITNAHVVDMGIKVALIRNGKRYPATILEISYECDIAVVVPKSRDFWDSVNFLELGAMPKKQDKIYVYGFPLGGENVSITKGIVSRVQIVGYADFVNRISLQIDAAINPGNSGGPAVNASGDVVGVVFAGMLEAQNMGFVIPVIILRHFIEYFSKFKKFKGLCELGLEIQNLENADLRHYKKLPPNKSGVMISGLSYKNDAAKKLRSGDIIMSVDGYRLDYSGNMLLRDIISAKYDIDTYDETNNEIAYFDNYIGIKLPDEQIKFEILRDGKTVNVSVRAEVHVSGIPIYPTEVSTKYTIVGGMVYVMLSHMLLKEKFEAGVAMFDVNEVIARKTEAIVLSKVLQSEYTQGYRAELLAVDTVNGKSIHDMKQFAKAVLKARANNKPLVIKYVNSKTVHVIGVEANKLKNNKLVIESNIGNIKEMVV